MFWPFGVTLRENYAVPLEVIASGIWPMEVHKEKHLATDRGLFLKQQSETNIPLKKLVGEMCREFW